MRSLWENTSERIYFDKLNGNISADVLIIGGGMAGILCAYMLKSAGVDCMLIESGRILEGVSADTTAKITLQHGFLYDKIIKRYSREKAQLYFDSQRKALREYERLCSIYPCDYENKDSYVYSLDDREKAEDEATALLSLGADAAFCENTELPFTVAGAVRVHSQAQFHPLKFGFAVAKSLPVYENTKAVEVSKEKVRTGNGEIRYKKLIIATPFPILNKHGGYFIKMYQHRSYVTALQGAEPVNAMYVDEADKGMSFRSFKNMLLIGGGDHRTGKKGGNWKELEEFRQAHYPSSEVVFRWAAQDCMTLDGLPYIGRYSKNTPDVFVATGFNKWGISSSMTAAMILKELVCGRESEYASLYSPMRSIWHPKLFVNAFETLTGLLTPFSPRCPHLGCALKYNPYEHSWDCPCHGSRFSESGELLDGPATDGKRIR